jgi:hypothetical protein
VLECAKVTKLKSLLKVAGARVAKLELYVGLAKLVQNFEWTTKGLVEPFNAVFIHPDRPLDIDWKLLAKE